MALQNRGGRRTLDRLGLVCSLSRSNILDLKEPAIEWIGQGDKAIQLILAIRAKAIPSKIKRVVNAVNAVSSIEQGVAPCWIGIGNSYVEMEILLAIEAS